MSNVEHEMQILDGPTSPGKSLQDDDLCFNILNTTPAPILVIDTVNSIKYVNPALEKLTGFSYGELIGTTPPYR